MTLPPFDVTIRLTLASGTFICERIRSNTPPDCIEVVEYTHDERHDGVMYTTLGIGSIIGWTVVEPPYAIYGAPEGRTGA